MKNNYPIRYAVVPIKDIDPITDSSIVYGYMITKCYVVGSRREYIKDEGSTTEYIISCPYITADNSTWKRTNIDKDHFVCVKNVYNSFNEAIKERVALNDELLKSMFSRCEYKELIKRVRTDFFNRLNIIRELEIKIEESTKDINPFEKEEDELLEEFEGFSNRYDYNSNDITISNMTIFKTAKSV